MTGAMVWRATAVAVAVMAMSGCATAPRSAIDSPPPDGVTTSAVPGTPSSNPPTAPADPTPTATSPGTNVQPDVAVSVIRASGDGGAITVAAQVNGLVEDGGACILTATSGAQSLTASSEASADTQSTICGALAISSVAAGDWSVTVAYSSPQHYGISAPMDVKVS